MSKDNIEIPGYDGVYSVDISGSIYSTYKSKTLKQQVNTKGYFFVTLCKNKERKQVMVHRLLAILFLPNAESFTDVNHIDGNKKNNSLSNLEWCTHSYNLKHAVRSGLIRSNPVTQHDLQGNQIKEFVSSNEADLELGYKKGSIMQSIYNNRPYRGHVWTLKPLYGTRSTNRVPC